MRIKVGLCVGLLVAVAAFGVRGRATAQGTQVSCPDGMVLIERDGTPGFCIDPFEATLAMADKTEADPYQPPSASDWIAKSEAGRVPQAYITQQQARDACGRAAKRLCARDEWLAACGGQPKTTWPYGERKRQGLCNVSGTDGLALIFGTRQGADHLYGPDTLSDPRINRVVGTLARTGSFGRCRSDQPIFDMVGNLHEWTAEPGGVLRGGYYRDAEQLGAGCAYAAVGHNTQYADYSTGFRCCSDVHRAP